ncbi:MAG: STM4015 family protein [Planctomycetota bacterium]
MTYSEHIDQFHGVKVVNFNTADDWQGPEIAYRLSEEYDDDVTIGDRLTALLQQPQINRLTKLIIGGWTGSCEGENSKEVVAALAAAAPKLQGLKHLFFGEMVLEECEISWINQSDVSPLLRAFPNLQSLRIRGGAELSFSKVRHDNLRELAIETGGLSRELIREIFLCEFPALEHLELLLGESNYGFDGGVEDLQPLLSGRLFPKLKWLGLMNSEIVNEIAAVIVNSPITSRLETLDLSLGNLDGEGVQSLTGLTAYPQLKTLNISHHYASEQQIAALQQILKCEVIADDLQEPEDDWRPIVHAE